MTNNKMQIIVGSGAPNAQPVWVKVFMGKKNSRIGRIAEGPDNGKIVIPMWTDFPKDG